VDLGNAEKSSHECQTMRYGNTLGMGNESMQADTLQQECHGMKISFINLFSAEGLPRLTPKMEIFEKFVSSGQFLFLDIPI
jgi:hypothetical protein